MDFQNCVGLADYVLLLELASQCLFFSKGCTCHQQQQQQQQRSLDVSGCSSHELKHGTLRRSRFCVGGEGPVASRLLLLGMELAQGSSSIEYSRGVK